MALLSKAARSLCSAGRKQPSLPAKDSKSRLNEDFDGYCGGGVTRTAGPVSSKLMPLSLVSPVASIVLDIWGVNTAQGRSDTNSRAQVGNYEYDKVSNCDVGITSMIVVTCTMVMLTDAGNSEDDARGKEKDHLFVFVWMDMSHGKKRADLAWHG